MNQIEPIKTNRISKILEDICKLIEFGPRNNDPGLIAGEMGNIIFLFHYARYRANNKLEDIAFERLQSVINNDEVYRYFSLSTGTAGIIWGIDYLFLNNFIDTGSKDLFGGLDNTLNKRMIQEVNNENFDFLHGGLGIALAYMQRMKYDKNVEKYLKKLINTLYWKSIIEMDKIKWFSRDTKDNSLEDNICLSHGISGIIYFLGRLIALGINVPKAEILIDGSIKYLLSQRIKSSLNGSVFPSKSIMDRDIDKGSRLAWCYGDLGIAISLLNTGLYLNDEKIIKIALNVFELSMQRRKLKENGVLDASICHGTSGISHIYYRAYQKTRDTRFIQASNYWLEETLEMIQDNKGILKYYYYKPDDENKTYNLTGILEGITGIGMAMLSRLNEDVIGWDECLLLAP